MAHTHDVYDTGKHFEINGISRFIKETSTTKLVLVQGDHKSEVVTFEMPRYIDGHDMLLCDKIRVHYINIETKTNNTSADIYEVTDLKLCEDCEEEEILLFTWTIEAPATKYFGSLSFLVKFECTEGDNILYQWNTAKYVNINVLNGIDNSEAFVDKYSNVLEEWYNKLMGESETVANLVEQLEDCEKVTASATSATSSCVEATENCISATEEAESVRAEIEAGGFIESLKEMNNGGKFSVWVGTQEEYDAIGTKNPNCLYVISNDNSVEVLNALAQHHVVDQDTIEVVQELSNGANTIVTWKYTKWSDGQCELFGHTRRTYDFSNVDTTDDKIIRSDAMSVKLPFKVYDKKAFFECDDINAWASAAHDGHNENYVTCVLWRRYNYENYNYDIFVHVVGNWKEG